MYRLGEATRVVVLDGECVILHERTDTYVLLDRAQSLSFLQAAYGDDVEDDTLCEFIELGLLVKGPSAGGPDIASFSRLPGVDNYNWHLRSQYLTDEKPKITDYFTSWLMLRRVSADLANGKFGDVLEMLRQIRQERRSLEVDLTRAKQLSKAVAVSSQMLKRRANCLETAITLSMLCLKRGLDAHFIIGIQKYDFLSHAWVEMDGEVIHDMPNLGTKLAPILMI